MLQGCEEATCEESPKVADFMLEHRGFEVTCKTLREEWILWLLIKRFGTDSLKLSC
jgi:hypothetical protein